MKHKNSYTTQEIVNEIAIGKLKNTEEDTFWWTSRKFAHRYRHEVAKEGDTFYDGNNGDKWVVIAANVKDQRLICENITQHGSMMVYWD
jgi:hypothetical protein